MPFFVAPCDVHSFDLIWPDIIVSKNNDPATLNRPHCEEFLERHVGLAVDFFVNIIVL